MIYRLDIIEYQDGHKELVYSTEDGETYMRPATDADVEAVTEFNKPITDPFLRAMFGDMLND